MIYIFFSISEGLRDLFFKMGISEEDNVMLKIYDEHQGDDCGEDLMKSCLGYKSRQKKQKKNPPFISTHGVANVKYL